MVEKEAAEEMIQALNTFLNDVYECLLVLKSDGQQCIDNMQGDAFSEKIVLRLNSIIERYQRISVQTGEIRDWLIRKMDELEELANQLPAEDD